MADNARKLGPYNLISKIGRGAFGVVWLAEKQTAIATTRFALKLSSDEAINLEAFRQEAGIWVQASGHANVLPIIDADIYDNQVVIVSEYIPDGSLAGWLKQYGGHAPTIEAACEIIDGVLAGLSHLHERRIIHRDLKPDNILLQRNTPRLADFGISRILRSDSYSANISGTLAYMAPEAFAGKRNERTDIWAVGVIFYQLLAGRLPYDERDAASLIGALTRQDAPPLPESIPEILRRIVMKALQRNPSLRYAAAAEVRHDLREAQHRLWLVNQTLPPTVVAPQITLPSPQPEPIIVALPSPQPAPVSPIFSNDDSKKPQRNWFYMAFVSIGILVTSAIVLITIVKTIPKDGNSKINPVAKSLLTASPTPALNYDIPEIKATVQGFSLFESGAEILPIEQRKYGTIFDKNSTRYVYYELNLKYPSPESRKYFTLEEVLYKGVNAINRHTRENYIEDTWTSSSATGGFGNSSSGSLGEGRYKLEIRYNGKIIASKNFEVQLSLEESEAGEKKIQQEPANANNLTANATKGQVLYVTNKANAQLVNGEWDAGFNVTGVVKNIGKSGDIKVIAFLSCSEGEWSRTQNLYFRADETKNLTYFFEEPTVNATNCQARISTSP